MNYFFFVWKHSYIWSAICKTKPPKMLLWTLNNGLIALSTVLGIRDFPEYKNYIGYKETLDFVSSRKHYIWEFIYFLYWQYFVAYKKQRVHESKYYDLIMECFEILKNKFPREIASNYNFKGTNTIYGTKVNGKVLIYDKIRFMYPDVIVFELTDKEFKAMIRRVKEIF